MRTIYFLELGQNLEDVKPSKRKRALLVSKDEWQKFGNHLKREQATLEAVEIKKQENEDRKLLSREMAKTWDNTIINYRKHRLDLRRERAAKLEADRHERFLIMRAEEADIKQNTVQEAKRLLQQQKDNSKSLLSALRFSEALRERGEQLKFNKMLKAIEDERERADALQVMKDVEMFKQELLDTKEKLNQEKTRLKQEKRKMFKEALENKGLDEAAIIREEREDIVNRQKEIDLIEENEKKEKIRKKELVLKGIMDNRKEIAEQEAIKKLEEEEEDAALEIQAATKKRIAKIRKQKENEIKIQALNRRQRIANAIAAGNALKEKNEEAIIRKAVAEKEAIEEKMQETRKSSQARLVKEMVEERQSWLQREKERKLKERELIKWEVMQREKHNEDNAMFKMKVANEKQQKIKNSRDSWDKQIAEAKALAALERKADLEAVKRAATFWNMEDSDFLSYAKSLIDECEQKGRPVYPLHQYVHQYKKETGLLLPRPLNPMWRSKVPIGEKACQLTAATSAEDNTKVSQNKLNASPAVAGNGLDCPHRPSKEHNCVLSTTKPSNGLAN